MKICTWGCNRSNQLQQGKVTLAALQGCRPLSPPALNTEPQRFSASLATQSTVAETPPLECPSSDKQERMQLRILSFKIPVPRDLPARLHTLAADRSAWTPAWPQGHTFYHLIDLRRTDTRPGGASVLFHRWPSTGMKSRGRQGCFCSMRWGPWGLVANENRWSFLIDSPSRLLGGDERTQPALSPRLHHFLFLLSPFPLFILAVPPRAQAGLQLPLWLREPEHSDLLASPAHPCHCRCAH